MHLATNLVPHASVRIFYHIPEDRNEEFPSIVKNVVFPEVHIISVSFSSAHGLIMAASVHSLSKPAHNNGRWDMCILSVA